jgi:hypothetical protein
MEGYKMRKLSIILFICATIAYPLTQRTKTEDGAFFLLEGIFTPPPPPAGGVGPVLWITSSGITVVIPTAKISTLNDSLASDTITNEQDDKNKVSIVPENQDYSVSVSPNPFNPSTKIFVTLPRDISVQTTSMKIIDVKGCLVRSFNCSSNNRQMYNLFWDGLSNTGNHVGPGMYFFVLKAGNKTFQNKLILAK